MEQPQAGSLLPAFFCPITDDIMRDPATTADGQTYERAAIQSWLERSDTSPAARGCPARRSRPTLRWDRLLRSGSTRTHCMFAGLISSCRVRRLRRGLSRGSTGGRCDSARRGVRTVLVAVLKMRRGDCATELPLRYMSPEAIQTGRFGEASYVWAFAVLVWEMLTLGNIPYFDISPPVGKRAAALVAQATNAKDAAEARAAQERKEKETLSLEKAALEERIARFSQRLKIFVKNLSGET